MKHDLVDLYQVCSKYVPGANNGPILGVTCFTKAYIGKNMTKIFSSETIRHRTLIFGMEHHLVDLYQVWSYYAPWANNGQAPGVTCFTKAYIGKNMEKSSCLKPYDLELIFLVCSII